MPVAWPARSLFHQKGWPTGPVALIGAQTPVFSGFKGMKRFLAGQTFAPDGANAGSLRLPTANRITLV